MREMFTTQEARGRGVTRHALDWGVKCGSWAHLGYGVYGFGPEPASLLDRSLAGALATGGAVGGSAAAALYGGLDLNEVVREHFVIPARSSNSRVGARRTQLVGSFGVLNGVCVTDGLQTLVDLAAEVDDTRWEHALEAALRKRLTTIAAIEAVLPVLSARKTKGVARIKRVLSMRPPGAAPTESLLETYAVQVIRHAGLPTPTRQFVVETVDGRFVARVDLCWPELGAFLELDGRGHAGQPEYDAARQNAVVAATGWLAIRLTWRQVVYNAAATARDVAAVLRHRIPA